MIELVSWAGGRQELLWFNMRPYPLGKRWKSAVGERFRPCNPRGRDATQCGGETSVGQSLRERWMRARTNQPEHRGSNGSTAPGEQRAARLRTALGMDGDQTVVPVREPMLQGVRANPDRPGHRIRRAGLGSGEGPLEQISSPFAQCPPLLTAPFGTAHPKDGVPPRVTMLDFASREAQLPFDRLHGTVRPLRYHAVQHGDGAGPSDSRSTPGRRGGGDRIPPRAMDDPARYE